ncbi:circularly permuted type 2 ATP-grasp protein [Chelatococcus reniformis]|uniref:circularly permuted type 2 ATP-grasp protein n=1 Tax=Chelatococcus reniformis TaxID=1494448 RepID=UPI0035716B5A
MPPLSDDRGDAAERRFLDWIEGYRPLPGIPDELFGPDGQPRPYWRRFLETLAAVPAEESERRFAAANRHIRDAGVTYRVYGEENDRSWPLGRIPLLIDEREWRGIAEGIAQRASLLEAILADVYGHGYLVADGALPAAAVTGSEDFLPEAHGIDPPGGRHLRIYAADIGRGPDGGWWVLADRTQAASGAGYALENRLVSSRAFPNLYNEMNVERLAPFFGAFRTGLTEAARRSDPRICLLTPGPFSQTYFEQAYLARYLGFLLVEGDDLIIHEGRLHVRTVAGLKRVDALWRRVDADFIDPLEFNSASRLGVPGLMQALRNGEVVVANMPGAGFVEGRALMGFLPALSQRLFGEDLKLPNIATWWCGQPRERAFVLDRLDDLAIAGAFDRSVPGLGSPAPVPGRSLTGAAREALVAAIERRPIDFVGQEVVRLSTMPVWEDGRLEPRPFVLRVYAAATADGWTVMPGGFCRVSSSPDARALSMGEGVQSADVWVLADKPVEITTLLPRSDAVKTRRIVGVLPSRAADNLFWLGRYLERAEATLRLVRCLCSSLIEADPAIHGTSPALERLERLLVAWGAVAPEQLGNPGAVATAALHGEANYGSAVALVRSARRTAARVRERLGSDAWRALTALAELLADDPHGLLTEAEAFDRADRALQWLGTLSGLAQENMNRVAGWPFIDIGRRIERGVVTCRFARQFAADDATVDDLDVLLDLVDSQITYRSRYIAGFALAPVRDMVALDPFNPRSVAFQVLRLRDHLAALPSLRADGLLEAPSRLGIALAAEMTTLEAEQLDVGRILAIEQRLLQLSEAIGSRYFLHGPGIARPEKLTGLA